MVVRIEIHNLEFSAVLEFKQNPHDYGVSTSRPERQ